MTRPVADPGCLCEMLVGEPATVETLKDKPGRRRTSLVCGPRGAAVVKAYASGRAPVVARRVGALAAGPAEPAIPRVLLLDEARRLVALSHLPGEPLTRALTAGNLEVVERAGAALGRWHAAWWHQVPPVLPVHPVERELAALHRQIRAAEPPVAAAVRGRLPGLTSPWPVPTVVHRDLYETQVVVGEQIGLIDLDDAAGGPPELDIGNLLAHLTLLGRRLGRLMTGERRALLTGYLGSGPDLDAGRLDQCESLSRLRLACIHREPALLST